MDRLGRYTLLDRIGEGGMAEVFRARLDGPMGFQKDLAIKRIRDTVVRQAEENVRSLINEARIGGRLKHPNIVEVYNLGEEEGAYYVAMELVDGPTLGAMLDAAKEAGIRLPGNVVVDVAMQVCRGLNFAHHFKGKNGEPAPVVHRDLKPSNVMISRTGAVKIMDYGIAKSASNLFNTTASGIAKGTPLYMSPEQLRGMRPLPTCSDLFSLGSIIYEMVTGRLLFAGRTIPEIITRVLSLPLDEPVAQVEAAMPGMGRILERLLERDVDERVQDAREIERELMHVMDWQEQTVPTAEFVQHFVEHGFEPQPLADTAPRREPVTAEQGPPDESRGELVESYRRARSWRRAGLLLALAAALAVGGAAGSYVYRGTLGLQLQSDGGLDALRRGDLPGAWAAWDTVVETNPAQAVALMRSARTGAWLGLDEPGQASLLDQLATLPEDEPADFVAKYRTTAWVHRRRGDSRQALLHLTWAREKAAKLDAVPPALLWELGEVSVLRGAFEAAGRAFADAGELLPPGRLSDAAQGWQEELQRGAGEILRAELRWQAGALDDEGWAGLPALLDADPRSKGRRDAERLVWAYRALDAWRWGLALALVRPMGPMPGEPERKRSQRSALAAALAAAGKPVEARRALGQALDKASTPEGRVACHFHVARALATTGGDREWLDELLAILEQEVGVDDLDLMQLVSIRDGEPLPGAPGLALDSRSGRFYAASWTRGSPGTTKLVPAGAWARENVGLGGLGWPFGPAFHPLDDAGLPAVFNPGR